MVDQGIITDLQTLRSSIAHGTEGPEAWCVCLDYIIGRLVGEACPECGRAMVWSGELAALRCPHHEE